jgi:hypothetical protein
VSSSLPEPDVRALIRPHTGAFTDIQPTARGFSSDLAALVECEKGPFFVKAARNRAGGRRDSLVREGVINPFVCPISPALRWRSEDANWIALGFDVVEGRSSDFAPGSADLPVVVETLDRIGELGLPEVARDWGETRWDRFAADEAEAALFRGDALLYTDINPSNLMIGDTNTWAVDWSWPTRGAGFIDPACLVVQLVATGHSAHSAEAWAAECTAWTKADPTAISAFAAATARMYRTFAERKPDAAWLGAMADAAQSWATHRSVAG